MKLFISIPIPDTIKDNICQLQNNIKKIDILEGTYVKRENLHITLLFLGQQSIIQTQEIINILKQITFEPFIIKLDDIELINSRHRSLICINIKSEQLIMLAKIIQEALLKFLDKQEHEFNGHITLVRIKKIKNIKLEDLCHTISNFKSNLSWTIDKFNLIKSETDQTGPKYEIIF